MFWERWRFTKDGVAMDVSKPRTFPYCLRVLACGLLCWFCESSVQGVAVTFQASGQSFFTNFIASGDVRSYINAPFFVAVDGRRVFIRLQYAEDHYAEWSYDGSYAYHLLDSPDRLNQAKGARAAATIREEEYPTDAVCILRNIWLGLGSTSYLSTNQSELLVPWGAKGLDGMRSYRWEIEHLESSPHLPKQIVFKAAEELWIAEEATRIEKLNKAFPLREGFVGGRFEVLETQPIEGLTIPSRFCLKRYRFDADKTKSERLLEYYLVTLTNFNTQRFTEFRPKIRRATDVSDMMEETKQKPLFGFIYTITNDAWLRRSDLRRKELIQKAELDYGRWLKGIKNGPVQSRNKFWMRLIFFGFFLVPGTTFLMFMIRGISRKNKPKLTT